MLVSLPVCLRHCCTGILPKLVQQERRIAQRSEFQREVDVYKKNSLTEAEASSTVTHRTNVRAWESKKPRMERQIQPLRTSLCDRGIANYVIPYSKPPVKLKSAILCIHNSGVQYPTFIAR